MHIIKTTLAVTLLSLGIFSCSDKPQPEDYDPEGSTITTSKEITFQVRKTWRFPGISFSNEYKGARLNDVEQVNDSVFHLYIEPENAPINNSPWYGYSVWSDSPRMIQTILHYPVDYGHRYYPKWSNDLRSWRSIDSAMFVQDTIRGTGTFTHHITPDTIFISAQPRYPSQHTYRWMDSITGNHDLHAKTVGYSVLGQPIRRLSIGNPSAEKTMVILGRQHPPEVTGYLAMQAFVKRFLQDDQLAQQFREQYSVLLYPMVNPDGVDQGHWRHNAAGIDLNRDWYEFNQPEPRAIRDDVAAFVAETNTSIVFEIDFHSTQEDLFYVFAPDRPSGITGFTHQWLNEVDRRIDDYTSVREETSGTSPVSTRYFYETYNTEAVTYEVGDNSTSARIKEVSETAAEVLMELLQKGGD